MRLFVILILSLMPGLLYSQFSELASMQFLRISPSPRASALGNAYTSLSGNGDTLFYNPGSAAFFKPTVPPSDASNSPFIKNISVSMAYSKLFYDLNYLMFSSLFDLRHLGVIGVGFTAMLYDDIAETTGTGVNTGKQLSSGDSLFILSYSDIFWKRWGLGGNLKFAMENAAGESISGLALDAGVTYRHATGQWGAGFAVQNAGIPVKKFDQSFQLPLNFRLGGHYGFDVYKKDPDTHSVILTADLGKGPDYDFSLGVGAEYGYKKTVFIRTGYQIQGSEPGFKAGAGLIYRMITADYAFTLMPDLGPVHKIGITYQFNRQNVVKKKQLKDITKKTTKRGVEINISDLVFEFKQSELKPKFVKLLDQVVKMLREYRDFNIKIEGYTDNVGTDQENLELSLLRAKTVYNYLVAKGINPKNMTYAGYGKSNPLADNGTEEGRQKNRRVNILITKKAK